MRPFFEDLFKYNQHCNQQLAIIYAHESTHLDTKSIALFSHILNAHHIWNHRILGKKGEYGVWDDHAIDTFATIDRLNHEETQRILQTGDLASEIAYRTTAGKPIVNTIKDTLFHVINHSTYHRGQIASLFRQQGIEPLVTDYIRFKH
ncbi:DinB family protein [Parapedobacter sp.]